MNNMQKSFKQKAQLGMRAANPIQKMQLGATPHMGSGKPPRMASGLAQRFADGGRVHGMGGPTQDKVSAKLSPGEYVLPADTVAAVGAHNLDGLRAATHVPVAPNAPNHFANGGQPVDIDNITRQGNSYTGTGVATPLPSPVAPVAPATASTSPIVRNGNSFSNISSSPAPLAPTVPNPAASLAPTIPNPAAPVTPVAPATPTINPSAAPALVSNGQVGRSAGLIPAPVTATPTINPSAAPVLVSNGQVGRSAGLIPASTPTAAPTTSGLSAAPTHVGGNQTELGDMVTGAAPYASPVIAGASTGMRVVQQQKILAAKQAAWDKANTGNTTLRQTPSIYNDPPKDYSAYESPPSARAQVIPDVGEPVSPTAEPTVQQNARASAAAEAKASAEAQYRATYGSKAPLPEGVEPVKLGLWQRAKDMASGAANKVLPTKPDLAGTPRPTAGNFTQRALSNVPGANGGLKAAAVAAKVAVAAPKVLTKVLPFVGAANDISRVVNTASNPKATAADVAGQALRQGGKLAAAAGGAEAGAAAGAFGGPFAPVTVPIGAALGGALAYFGADKLLPGHDAPSYLDKALAPGVGAATPKPTAAKAAPVAAAAAAATPAVNPALAAQQAATAQANAALPAGLKDAQGNLNGDAIFAAQPGAVAGAPIAAAQAQQVQRAMQQGLRVGSSPVSGDGSPIPTTGRYADPAAAEAYYRNRTESQLSTQGIAESNAFARAQTRGMNASTLARDNAAYASRGMNVTRSSDGKGGVLYSDAPNPYMNSKFVGGRTGNDIAADNKAQEKIGLQEAQIRQQAHADDAVLAQRQQLMDAVKNAPSVARQNAAVGALSVFNQNNASDKDRAERAQERAASLRAAQYQYQTAHEDRMQVREMEAHKQGFTEQQARRKQNDDMIRALSMDPSKGTLDADKYAKNLAFATSTLAGLKDANGVPTPKDLGDADPDTMKNIRLGMGARDATPRFDSVLKPLGLGASQPVNLDQSMATDVRDGIGGPEYLINGSWIPENSITGASIFGYGGNNEQRTRLEAQVAEYRRQSGARK